MPLPSIFRRSAPIVGVSLFVPPSGPTFVTAVSLQLPFIWEAALGKAVRPRSRTYLGPSHQPGGGRCRGQVEYHHPNDDPLSSIDLPQPRRLVREIKFVETLKDGSVRVRGKRFWS